MKSLYCNHCCNALHPVINSSDVGLAYSSISGVSSSFPSKVEFSSNCKEGLCSIIERCYDGIDTTMIDSSKCIRPLHVECSPAAHDHYERAASKNLCKVKNSARLRME